MGAGSGGSFFSEAPRTTGSATTSQSGNLNQAMPRQLTGSRQSGSGPYLPPADVGGQGRGGQMANTDAGGQPMPQQQSSSSSVRTQDLPDLPQSSNGGSQQNMPAQANAQPLFEDNSVPAAAKATTSQPTAIAASGETFQHTIEPGESLYAIARRYDVTTDAVARANNLSAPDQIFVGQKLTIPGRPDLQTARSQQQTAPNASQQAQSTQAVTPDTPPVNAEPANDEPDAQTRTASINRDANVSSAGNFRWPVRGRVITDFAASRETGINIEAPEGSAVHAAENGTVIYVGDDVEGYGNLVLVRHSNGFVTAYAHMKNVSVSKDDVVDRGAQLGTVGMTGSVSRPQLHFELRKGANPVDPMPQLAG